MKNLRRCLLVVLAMLLVASSVFPVGAVGSGETHMLEASFRIAETQGATGANELMPMGASNCSRFSGGDTYGEYVWDSLDAALKYYNMTKKSVHGCDVWYNGIHYSFYVQMESFRIYVRLA